MASVLETIVFEPARFLQELQAFDDLLKSEADLSEREDIQPFFKKSIHLTAYLGTFASSKNTQGFSATFGPGHTSFTGLLVMGRNANLDEIKKSRLKWRTDTVSIGKHKVSCITFDDLHAGLQRKFNLYRAGSKIETTSEAAGLPPPQDDK
jgi:Domain of unknown function (DUF4263)